MSISYRVTDQSTRVNSTGTFGRIVENAQNVLSEQNVSIFNKDTFKYDVLLDEGTWESYKGAMLAECDADDQGMISSLFESTRQANIEGMMSILGESATNLDVFTTYTFPLIRNIWPRTSMKYSAISTVVKKQTFNISYIIPQIIKDGRVYDLDTITEADGMEGFLFCPALYNGVIKLANFDITQTVEGTSVTENYTGAGTNAGFDLIESVPGVVANRVTGSGIDTNISIVAIEVSDATDLITNLYITPDLRGYFNTEIKYMSDAVEESGTNGQPGYVPAAPAAQQTETIIGRVDFAEGRLFVTSFSGKVTGVKVKGRLSPEYNNHTQSIIYSTRNDEFRIPIGAHLNAPVTQELLQDTQNMFQIDGAAKLIEIMGEVFAQQLDLEYKQEFIDGAMAQGGRYVVEKYFDCKPYPTFMGSPADWRESLKTVINNAASTIKNDTRFSGGKFVLVGNDLDIDLIANVSWTFSGTTGAEKSGVATEYRIGAYAGLHNYEVVGVQKRLPQGAIYMIYLSEDDRQMTNRYFPYTFNVCESKYLDPNRSLVPNIMMSKRHLMKRFRNVIAKIDIRNNTGNVNHFENYNAAGEVVAG